MTKKYKIVFSRDDCIGCGACTNTCPDNWEMDVSGDKAKPKVLDIDETMYSCNNDAEEVCPVGAIKIEEIN
ncbi:MAG: ferredoxin [DPANN group archaeon]|nr:ferredoxin [DPANN group archaeon]